MAWRSKAAKGGAKRAEQALAAATIGRVAGPADGADAVRGALARTELERPLKKVAIADVGAARAAGAIAAALSGDWPVTAGPARVLRLEGVDAVVAVVPQGMPAADAVAELQRVDELLLGVVIVGDATAPKREAAPAPDDPLAALRALERAADVPAAPLPPPPVAPPPAVAPLPPPREPAPDRGELAAAERRAAELEARVDELQNELSAAEQRAARAEQRVAELEARPAEPAQPTPAAPADSRGLFGRRRRAEAAAAEPPVLLPPHQPEPQAEPGPQPEPEPEPARLVWSGDPKLGDLERLVAAARQAGRPEAEEWAFYIPLLRDHAASDGTLPPEFDDLVRDVFGSAISA